MKKVLIITTHFAPDRHVGAKRMTKFAKYLPNYYWQQLILEMKGFHKIKLLHKSGQLSFNMANVKEGTWR